MTISTAVNNLRSVVLRLQQSADNYTYWTLETEAQQLVRPPLPEEESQRYLAAHSEAALTRLSDFYLACNGWSLMDVHVGYRVFRVEQFPPGARSTDIRWVCLGLSRQEMHEVIRNRAEHEETRPPVFSSQPVLLIGSTGGGRMFVVSVADGSVWILPDGYVIGTIYYSTETVDTMIVATSLENFVERMTDDVIAFTEQRSGYKFMAY